MWIKNEDSIMIRRGWRGKKLTVYLHRYNGKREQTGRYHDHPFRKAISIVLFGYIAEYIPREFCRDIRTEFNVRVYSHGELHRVLKGSGWSLFIGLDRVSSKMANATERVEQGYCHYSELSKKEADLLKKRAKE